MQKWMGGLNQSTSDAPKVVWASNKARQGEGPAQAEVMDRVCDDLCLM